MLFGVNEQSIPGVAKIKDNYNPATWMLEVTSQSVEIELNMDFAKIYKESALYKWAEYLKNNWNLSFITSSCVFSVAGATMNLINSWANRIPGQAICTSRELLRRAGGNSSNLVYGRWACLTGEALLTTWCESFTLYSPLWYLVYSSGSKATRCNVTNLPKVPYKP